MRHSNILSRNKIILIFLALIPVGLWQSARQAFLTWYPDPDLGAFALLSQEIIQHGLGTIYNFSFLADNLLFSIALPNTLLFYITGSTSPRLIIASGVLCLWVTTLLIALIVTSVSSWKRGVISAFIILFASQGALGAAGQLTYPATHNVSFMWGLFGILLLILWIQKRAILYLISSTIILSLATFSDPWLLATIVLPTIVSSILLLGSDGIRSWPPGTRQSFLNSQSILWFGVFVASVFTLLVAKSDLVGLLPLINRGGISLDHMGFSIHSLLDFFAYIPYFFNFIPSTLATPSYLLASPRAVLNEHHLFPTWMITIDCTVLLVSLAFLFICSVKYWSKFDAAQRFICSLSITTIICGLCAWCVVDHYNHFIEARWMINLFYAPLLLGSVITTVKIPKLFLKVSFLLLSLWISSNFISNLKVWETHPLAVQHNPRTDFLIKTLAEKGIHQAYGHYWLTDANSVRWLSKDNIHMLPINYRTDYQGFERADLTLPSWYDDSQHTWAIVLSSEEKCSPFASCTDAVINQFGQPSHILYEGIFSFLIYKKDHPQFPQFSGETTARRSLDPRLVNNNLSFDGWRNKDTNLKSASETPSISIPLENTYRSSITIELKLASYGGLENVSLYTGDKLLKQQLKLNKRQTSYVIPLHLEKSQKSVDLSFRIYPQKRRGKSGIRLYQVLISNKNSTHQKSIWFSISRKHTW